MATDLPVASVADMEALFEAGAPMPELGATAASHGLAARFTERTAEPNSAEVIKEITLLVWAIHHSLGALGYYLHYLMKGILAVHVDSSEHTIREKLTSAIRLVQSLIRDQANDPQYSPLFLGLYRDSAPTASLQPMEVCARALARRLRAWTWPANEEAATAPVIPPALQTFPMPIAVLMTPQTALVWDLCGQTACQLAYALYASLTFGGLGASIRAGRAVRSANEAQSQVEGTESALAARLDQLQQAQAQAVPRNDGHGQLFNLWRIRSKAIKLVFILRIAIMCILPAMEDHCVIPPESAVYLLPDLTNLATYLEGYFQRTRMSTGYAGATPAIGANAKQSRNEGIKLLRAERGYSKSAYHMPGLEALQVEWEEWFDKLSSLLEQYEMFDLDIIRHVTNHLKGDHTVIVGWQSKMDDLLSSGKQILLSDFFAHARARLFTEDCMRKNAWAMLNHMCAKGCPDHEDSDCVVTALRELFGRLFPKRHTAEQPPCTMREATQLVYSMLVRLNKGGMKPITSFHRAWAQFQYDSTAKFVKFLDPDLHTGKREAESHELYHSYLEDAYECLRAAHKIYHVLQPAVHPGDGARAGHVLLTVGDDGLTAASKPDDAWDNACDDWVFAIGDPQRRRKLEHALALHPKARRTALTPAFPAARPVADAGNAGQAAQGAPPGGSTSQQWINQVPPQTAQDDAGGRGGRGGGRGGRGRDGGGRGRGRRGKSKDGPRVIVDKTVNGVTKKYFADNDERMWDDGEWYQLEANAPLRARVDTLATALGIADHSLPTCLASQSMEACPLCQQNRHRFLETCQTLNNRKFGEVAECLKHRTAWRSHARKCHDIRTACETWGSNPPLIYQEYPNPPPAQQVSTAYHDFHAWTKAPTAKGAA